MIGTTIFFDRVRGWGFLAPADGSDDVFVHHTAIRLPNPQRRLQQGQEVEFEIGERNGKRIALNVRPVSPVSGGAR